jgi:light-regulated signal transduction histidine kinase (bacteriophytochrome)
MSEAPLDAYAALAAHQLGEAVCVVRGYATLLSDSEPVAARGLAAGADRVQRFVDDLLDVRVAGTADLVVERVELDRVVAAAAASLQDHLRASDACLQVGPLPAALGDSAMLERLFVHLLRGALAARTGGPPSISVRGHEEERCVVVAVRDNGRDLEPDAARTFFEPFSRGRGSGTLIGAGVGLAVCARIVERHGGAIAARPARGGGAEMVFSLPRVA